ncbi:MAG: 30S ribosomal protein S6 [Paracoccaceae bacterium]
MPLYEHTFIARQDISNAQAEGLIEHFGQVLTDNGGTIVGTEYWGLKTLAYKVNKNRKGHYGYIRSDSPPEAVQEMERLMRIHDDVMRVLTVRVEVHEEGPSAVIQARSSRDDRGGRGGRDRDRGDRGDGRDRDDRPPRGDRDDRPPRGDRDDRPPRGDRDDRPPRRDRDDRPPRDGDRPTAGE